MIQSIINNAPTIGILVSVLWAVFEYVRSKRIEKIKFILELHKRFTDSDVLSRIRSKIESSDSELFKMIEAINKFPKATYEELSLKTGVPINSILISEFDEYLGFFELLANLWRRKKIQLRDISLRDIGGIFGYYLLCLRERSEVWEYLNVEVFNFETTRELILQWNNATGIRYTYPQSENFKDITKLDEDNLPKKVHIDKKILKNWWEKNKAIFTVQFFKGKLTGYYAILPLKKEAMDRFIKGGLSELNVKPEDIHDRFETLDLESIYLFSIVSYKKHSKLSKKLIEQTFSTLNIFIENGKLRHIYAVAVTSDGLQLLKQNGFELLRAADQRPDHYPLFVRNITSSADKLLCASYRKTLKYRHQSKIGKKG